MIPPIMCFNCYKHPIDFQGGKIICRACELSTIVQQKPPKEPKKKKHTQGITCPKPSCTTYYRHESLKNHFQIMHSEMLYNNGTELKRTFRDIPFKNFNKDKKAYMLQDGHQTYFFMIYFTSHPDQKNRKRIGTYSFNFGVYHLKSGQKTACTYDLSVTLTDSHNETTFKWHNVAIEEYKGSEHCLRCLDENCIFGHKQRPAYFLKNNIHDIKNSGQDFYLTYSVKLVHHKQKIDKALSSLDLEVCCSNASKGCGYVGGIKDTKEHLTQCLFNKCV